MPIKPAAMKALRQAKTRTLRNDDVRDGLAYLRRMLRKALEAGDVKGAEKLMHETIRAIDRAMQKKVVKKNTGARVKSRLMANLHKAKAASKK